jgi:HEAT repeat protein
MPDRQFAICNLQFAFCNLFRSHGPFARISGRTALSTVIVAALILAAAPAAAWAQTNSKEILALPAAKLVEVLRRPDAPIFEKAKACQRLAVVGDKDAIPALVALLPDEKLNLYARFGLEGIPDPAVDDALREATTKLQGRQLVGAIDSIGQRKDAKAIELLKGFLGNADAPVASAAAGALGRIGTPEAAAVIKAALAKDSPVKNCLGDGGLACAEALVAAGKTVEAVDLYDAVSAAGVAKHIKIAALGHEARLAKAGAVEIVLTQIRSSDKALFNLGLALARQIPGANLTTALAGELEKLPPERQALLLRALGDRKEPAPLPVVLEATKSKSAAVREAAIGVLARHGDASAVAILLDAALGEGEVAAAAKEGLKTLSGQEVDAAVAAKLAGADAKAKVVLFELAGARRLTATEPAVRAALADGDEPVRLAAITALGQLIELKDLELLTSRALSGTAAAETTTAQRALRTAALRMGDREGCAARLAECLKGASSANQVYLLELQGRISGAKALETVIASVKSDDPAIKDAATRILGNWVNPDAAVPLLEIAKSDSDAKYQIRALRGYIRIARQLQLPEAKRLDMFRTAMEVAKRAEEKQLALDILTRIPSAQTLELAVSFLGEPALKNAAAQAAVRIAPKLVGRNPKAVAEAMQKVTEAGIGGNAGTRAKQLLDQAKAGAK